MNAMNILITAGGNTEKIDEVRAIRNTGTGRLGALIAVDILAGLPDARIHYVCDRHAVTPAGDRVSVTYADDVTALEAAVRDVCAARRIDAVVHSMAVSDYRVKNVTTAMNAANAAAGAMAAGSAPDKLAEEIAGAPNVLERGKISSELDDVIVVLERAPKVISLYRDLAPDAVIIGFKLLTNVSEQELIRVGTNLLTRNRCDYVLANDTKYLSAGGHVGHLIARDGSYRTFDGKPAIARAIADAVIREEPK
jgi:phosphopantothenate-cysteine ligase